MRDPLILYSSYDKRMHARLIVHLHCLGICGRSITVDNLTVDGECSGLEGSIRLDEIEEQQPLIFLLSVDSLVVFIKQLQISKLLRMIGQRVRRYGLAGVILVEFRPCPWQDHIMADPRTLDIFPSYGGPIYGRRHLDQVYLEVADSIRVSLQKWDNALSLPAKESLS